MHSIGTFSSSAQRLSSDELTYIFSFAPHPTLRRVCALWNQVFPHIAPYLLHEKESDDIEKMYRERLEEPCQTIMTLAHTIPSWELYTTCMQNPLDLITVSTKIEEIEARNLSVFFHDILKNHIRTIPAINPRDPVLIQAQHIHEWLVESAILDRIEILNINSNYLTAFPSTIPSFPRLKILGISCPNLQGLPNFPAKQLFPNLSELSIYNAGYMRTLPTELHALPIHIKIYKADHLESIPDAIWDSTAIKTIEVKQCPELRWSAQQLYRFLSKPKRTFIGAPQDILTEAGRIRIELSRRALEQRSAALARKKEELQRILCITQDLRSSPKINII